MPTLKGVRKALGDYIARYRSNLVSVLVLLVAILAFLTPGVAFSPANPNSVSTVALIVVLAGLGILAMVRSLRSERSTYGEAATVSRGLAERLAKSVSRLENMEAKRSPDLNLDLSADEKKGLIETIAKIAGAKIRVQAEEAMPGRRIGKDVQRFQTNSLTRLADHIGALGNRANYLLVAGVSFALLGVLYLGADLTFNKQAPNADPLTFAGHYLPRLSLTVIVELVAFFFLRTYVRTLTDIRYMQNEITNVEMKLIGLHASLDHELEKVTEKALQALIQTERNHVLEKGQSSLELERERVESQAFTDGMSAVATFMQGALRKPDEAEKKD